MSDGAKGNDFTPSVTPSSLLRRCMRAGGTLALATGAERGARFLRNIIMARLLAPDQFGLMAIVLAVSHLFEALTEVGVRQSVIQNRKGDTDAFLNVAWWFSAVRGLGLCALGFLVTPWISDFYEDGTLSPLLRVAFLSLALAGLTSPRVYVLEKHLRFGRYVWIMQGSGLAGTVISVVAALFIRNVWALVFGFVGEAAVRLLISFVACPIRPNLRFDRSCSRELFAFARGMVGLPLLTFVVMQADIFVLGKLLSKEVLGMYALALALANMPVMLFSRVAQPLMLPVLSEMHEDLRRLRQTLLQITRFMFLFGIPTATCLAVFGRPLLTLVYGRAYGAMTTAFGILTSYLFVYILGTVIVSTYMAIGRPELQRRFVALRALLVVLLIYPAARRFGPPGAAAALLMCAILANLIQLRIMKRHLELPMGHYLATAHEGVLMGVLVALPALAIRFLWNGPPATQLLIGLGLCGLAWGINLFRLRATGVIRLLRTQEGMTTSS